MVVPILATKLYIPPPRPKIVHRPRLIKRLTEGLHRKMTLISAPAGFGKTTLASEWVDGCQRPVAWLSLDEGDNDATRFLAYLIAALQTIAPGVGEGVWGMLETPQRPPTESILTALINEIAAVPDSIVLVLDDYHVLDAKAVNEALAFLIEHLPQQMHLVIATREDPSLSLARLRAQSQLTELRAADLRFSPSEASTFLNDVMGLGVSAEDIAALEKRTEGWIGGLQLAAISIRGHKDAADFIQSFSGSHHFVLDYLVEEVLEQQPQRIQTFLLHTSILDRLCGSLCDAVVRDPSASGQETLERLTMANLFLVPLDNERRWYRYHHLFADLLRQRLQQKNASSSEGMVAELHCRASVWYEENGLEIEAFQHAASAKDIGRAQRLVEGDGIPLSYRGVMTPVLSWLESLPETELNARPSLWVTYASLLTMTGQPIDKVEEKLQAAEAMVQSAETEEKTRDLVGRIAAIRAMLGIPQNQVQTILTQSRRALEYLHPDNLPVRTNAAWTLGFAHQLQGDRVAASRAYREAISISQASGNIMVTIAATICLGQVQESENRLFEAAESYRRVLQLAGDPPLPAACEAHLGLARVLYQWNDLDAAQEHGQQGEQLARLMATVDTPAACQMLLARLKLARGDAAGATALLAEAEAFVRQHNFEHRISDITSAQVLVLLHQGNLAAAAGLAQAHELPISQARVHLAQGDSTRALAVLNPLRRQADQRKWADDRLRVMVLQAVAQHMHGEKDRALQLLGEALALAEPGGFIRLFVDEGTPMALLLSAAAARGIMPAYTRKLLPLLKADDKSYAPSAQPLVEPLSQRELEVLQLIAEGLSNREIGERLFVAINTVKGHNRRIFRKLQVQRRTEAVARAQELGLL